MRTPSQRTSAGPSNPSEVVSGLEDWSGLPGADLVEDGLEGLRRGDADSANGLLVAMAASTLRRLAIPVPSRELAPEPEQRLYQVVAAEHPRGTHAYYQGLLERLDSFLRAREHQVYRARRVAARAANPA